jgi:hypothetical protein
MNNRAPIAHCQHFFLRDRVEVIHFHGNPWCASGLMVGHLADETVKINLKNELASGRFVFAYVNAELPENSVSEYSVTGSSLRIGVYDAEGLTPLPASVFNINDLDRTRGCRFLHAIV